MWPGLRKVLLNSEFYEFLNTYFIYIITVFLAFQIWHLYTFDPFITEKLPKYNNYTNSTLYNIHLRKYVCQNPDPFIGFWCRSGKTQVSTYLSLQCFWSDSQIRGLAQKRVNLVLLCDIGMANIMEPQAWTNTGFWRFCSKTYMYWWVRAEISRAEMMGWLELGHFNFWAETELSIFLINIFF